MTSRRSTKQRLQEGLKELRLPTMRSNVQEVAAKARAESLSYEQFLLDLVEREQDTRRQHRIQRALRASNLPLDKTHLLCAIGYELVYADFRVRFRECSLLVQELLAAKRDLELPRLLKQLDRYHALVLDDIGYVQQAREEMEVLFNLLAHRYERGSVMLTSNLAFSEWDKIFKDQMTTAAAIDRLVHHCVVLELEEVPSFRLEEAKKRGNA